MENSPLERLPAELRNEIYRLVVSDNKPLTVGARSPGYHKAIQPPITRVCRQTRDETLTMVYNCNDFVFEVISPRCRWDLDCNIFHRICEIKRWLECTSEENRRAIQKLLIVCGSDSRPSKYDLVWRLLVEMLLDYGYGGEAERRNKFKCSIHVHMVFDDHARMLATYEARLSIDAYCQRQELQSRKVFEDLGFDVQVTSEQVHDT